MFPAREAPIPGVSGALVAEAARAAGADDVRYHADLATLPEALSETLGAGDLLVTLGAGSIETLGASVARRLEERVHA